MTYTAVSLVAKGVAVAYGCVALAVAVIYSLTKRDTWKKASNDDKEDFQEGWTRQQLRNSLQR